MAHRLAHGNCNYGEFRDVRYTYDELNRLINVNDSKQDVFDEIFAYDAQGRITMQRRGANAKSSVTSGGEYSYEGGTNKLKSVANGMDGTTADERNMSDTANFVYDSEGNLVEDKSKRMKISYDWRGMPVEFRLEPTGSSSDTARLSMMYDGSGRRISKTLLTKSATAASWDTVKVTHYTGIGTEVREEFHNGSRERGNVVVNMPQGLGRYKVADASQLADDNASRTFEWYLKNHLGSTMLVYGTEAFTNPNTADIGETKAAYDYRAFGEMVTLSQPSDKVTENFTGKELDDEIELGYWGARYLDLMLGVWISVDPARQFASPYLYAGNGYNPVNGVDEDGNEVKGTFSKSTGILTLRDNDSGKEVSGKYFTGGIAGAPIPNGTYEILEQAQREGFYRLDLVDVNPRNDVAELPDGSTRDRFRLHGQGMSLGCVTACEGTDHSKIDKFLQNTKTSVVKDNYDAPWYVDLKNFFSGSDNESNINKYGELDVTE